MKKSDFVRHVKGLIKPLSPTEQINTLEKMKTWIDEIIAEKKAKKIYCNNCNKYIPESKFQRTSEHKIRNEAIYIDSGYGDDDTYGEVEYLVKYITCPLCGNKEEVNKIYLRVISEYQKNGTKIR